MNKVSQNLLITAGVICALFLAWYFSNIVAYLLISAIVALVGRPIVSFLNNIKIKGKNLPRWLCATGGLLTIMLIFYLFLAFFIPLIAAQTQLLANVDVNELVDILTVPFTKLEDIVTRIFPDSEFSFNAFFSEKVASILDPSFVLSSFGSITNFIASMAMGIFSVSFISFFFMKEESLFMDGVVIFFPAKYEQSIRHAWDSSTKILMKYFIGVFAEIVCVMVVLAFGLKFIAGLNASTAVLLGLLAGILNIIPYVGPLIAATITLIVALAVNLDVIEWSNFYILVIKVLGVFSAMKLIDYFVFQPYIFADNLKAHPLEIFLLILIAGSFAGIGGMLIAVPTYMVLRVFAKEFLSRFRIVQKLTEKI